MRHSALPALLAAAALAVSACGNDDEQESAERPSAPASTGTTATPPAGAESDATQRKPKVAKPEGAPPRKLQVEDLVKGTGAVAKAGDEVTVDYVGVSHSTGKEFDSSWSRNEPFTFPLGAQQVIPGWDEGVPGMRVGGRRKLTIPPDLAYGAQGAPPDIGPNETLVFVIDLRRVGP